MELRLVSISTIQDVLDNDIIIYCSRQPSLSRSGYLIIMTLSHKELLDPALFSKP